MLQHLPKFLYKKACDLYTNCWRSLFCWSREVQK